jgi:hypothetical protein
MYGDKVHVNDGKEINAGLIDRIRNMVSYGMSPEEIVATIPGTPTAPARWISWIANGIQNNRI